METKTYNGYTNYETLAVALWIDNEQSSQQYWESVADELSNPEYIADENTQKCRLADRLKDEHEEALPELPRIRSGLAQRGHVGD